MNIYYTISAEIRLQTIISARAKLNDTLNSVLKHQQPICLYIILYQHVWDATANSIRLSLLKRPTTPSTHWHILKKSFIWSHHELSSETDGVNAKKKTTLGWFWGTQTLNAHINPPFAPTLGCLTTGVPNVQTNADTITCSRLLPWFASTLNSTQKNLPCSMIITLPTRPSAQRFP